MSARREPELFGVPMPDDLFEFLIQLARDREAGRVLPLVEYQRRFPGREVEIAAEYDRGQQKRVSSAAPAPLSSAEPMGNEFATRRLMERLRAHPPAEGRYRRQDQIGSGGMGVVLRVADDELRRSIALKKLRKHGEKAVATFLDEAQITAQLDHPGIVPVHDLGVDPDGTPYFTMRYVKGKTLSEVFELVKAKDREWTQMRTLNVLLRVCEALAYAHSKHVIHRDLKPTNVMCGEFGETYVMDWGVARVLTQDEAAGNASAAAPARTDSSVRTTFRDATAETPGSPLLTRDGDVMGTPCYMPPEQAGGRIDELGPWSDVYAVGAILYQLLTGHAPYGDRPSARSPYEMLARVCVGPPKPVLALNPKVSGELAAICERAMARDWRDRYPDMREMATDLRAYLEQRVVRAYRTGAWQELKKWCARNRLAAVFVALFVIAAGISIQAITTWMNERDQELVSRQAKRKATDINGWPFQTTAHRLEASETLAGLRRDLEDLDALDPRAAERAREWLERGGRNRPRVRDVALWLRFWRVNCEQSRPESERPFAAHYPAPLALVEAEADLAHARRLAKLNPGAWAACVKHLEVRAEAVRTEAQAQSMARFHDEEERRLYDALGSFLDELRAFSDESDPACLTTAIDEQLQSSSRMSADLDETARAAWEKACSSMRDVALCPAYGGWAVRPQAGLLPLGRHPASGLWAFAHLRSGTLPQPNGAGSWTVDADSCIVLVLVPAAPESEVDGHTAAPREPYFLAERPLTLGQWLRLGGAWPRGVDASTWTAGDPALARPVTNVTWDETLVVLVSGWLQFPTGSQWSRALRSSDFGMEVAGSNSSERALASAFVREPLPVALRAHATASALWSPPDAVREWLRDDVYVLESSANAPLGPTVKAICGPSKAPSAEAGSAREQEGRLQNTRWSFVGVRPVRFVVP